MLPKKKRITKDLFQDIMKNGKTASSPLFTLRYIPSKVGQYAVVAPKTVAKQAVLRNKLRRKGYSILAKIPQKPSILGIFFYKKEAKQADFQALESDMMALLSKIRL